MRRAGDGEPSAGEALWRFSLALYARPGVAAALLALQDRAGRDVNLMLFALWLGAARGRRIGAPGLAAAARAVAPLNAALVHPLRRLRRALPAGADPATGALRRRLLMLELAGERQAQSRLAATAEAPEAAQSAARLAAAEANLTLYLGEAAASPEAQLLRQATAALIRAG